MFSTSEIESFINCGFIKVENAIEDQQLFQWLCKIYSRMNLSNEDCNQEERIRRFRAMSNIPIQTFSLKLWHCICQIVGGENKVKSKLIYDSFTLNYPSKQQWIPALATSKGWHVDGNDFVHFIYSPDQALVVLIYMSDVAEKGGGTFVATDSPPIVAQFLMKNPDGILPWEYPYKMLKDQSDQFVELTGKTGDIFILHPLALHTFSINSSENVRILCNIRIDLSEPLNFHRSNTKNFSILEQSILGYLNLPFLNIDFNHKVGIRIPPRW
jgi:hypothetical protein